jgi:heme oxygenase (biliverdin-IX-beta and delta-forming)
MTTVSVESIHARLKRETASLHLGVERALPLVSPVLTLDRYREVLKLFYGFYAPYEARMSPLASLVPFALPCRTARLVQDLGTLGVSVHDLAALPRCALPSVIGIEQLAGWLYVFEGAALGGQVVARALRSSLGIDATSGAAFFVGDGTSTSARWRQVLDWLDEIAIVEGAPDTMTASACEAFISLRDWMDHLDA